MEVGFCDFVGLLGFGGFFPITTLSFLPLSWELVKIKNYITGNVIPPFSVWEKLGKIVVENKPKAKKSPIC